MNPVGPSAPRRARRLCALGAAPYLAVSLWVPAAFGSLAVTSTAVAQASPSAPGEDPIHAVPGAENVAPAPQATRPARRRARRRVVTPPPNQEAYAAWAANDPDSAYFSNREARLSEQDEAALRALETNRPHTGPTSRPVVGQDGSIRFTFGSQHTSIVCAPLQVCDVALQPGEHVSSVNLGDTARWSVEPAITGVAPQEVQHLIVKPADVGLETSLVVTTDRRTYHLKLRSHRTKFMPSVSFLYPEDTEAKWAALRNQRGANAMRPKLKSPRPNDTYLGSLSFNYEIEGDDPPWKPLRVYNDGIKTVIEMPFAMHYTEAPALLVLRSEGGLFSDDETVMVNYRVHDTKYIVDTIFDKAILISGVGSDQEKVKIVRK